MDPERAGETRQQGFLLFMPSQLPFAPHGSLQDLEDTLVGSLKPARLYFDILNRRVLNWYADCNYRYPGERDHPTEVDRQCPNSKPTIYSEDVLAYGAAIDRCSRAFTHIFKSSRSRFRLSSPYQIATALVIKQICVRLGLPQITVHEHQITALCAGLLEFEVEILEPKNENQAFKRSHEKCRNLYKNSSADNPSLEVRSAIEHNGRHTVGASQYNTCHLSCWSGR
ncbi:hypothetical protein EAF00_011229 [Botryotinia globosa]|nr:hypothetical protein EAF00_011229 [Botryotinia globosa]